MIKIYYNVVMLLHEYSHQLKRFATIIICNCDIERIIVFLTQN